MRFWFDTEFLEDGKTIELISIGIVSEDGLRYYAENSEYDLSKSHKWLEENVHPHLLGGAALKSRKQIADEVKRFLGYRPEIWAYYGAYDWVVFCQLYGRMIDLPVKQLKWPMYVMDVKQFADDLGNPTLPKHEGKTHHALADALWTKHAWEYLVAYQRKMNSDD